MERERGYATVCCRCYFRKNADAKTTITKNLVIPVRDPQGEKKLDRNYIYTVNAVIKYLDTKTDIDYDGKEDYLKWAITKWTEGEDTHVNADGASYLVVSPTAIDIKGGESNDLQITPCVGLHLMNVTLRIQLLIILTDMVISSPDRMDRSRQISKSLQEIAIEDG